MNKNLIKLLQATDLAHVKQALEILDVLGDTEETLIEMMGMPSDSGTAGLQALYVWAGGQFKHAIYITFWIFARFYEFRTPWALQTHSVSLRGILNRWTELPFEMKDVPLKRVDLSQNRLDTVPKGLEYWNIEHLILTDNHLTSVDFSKGYTSLKKVELSHTYLVECQFSPLHQDQLESFICRTDTPEEPHIFNSVNSPLQFLRGLRTLDLSTSRSTYQYELRKELTRADTIQNRHFDHVITNPMMTWNPPPRSYPSGSQNRTRISRPSSLWRAHGNQKATQHKLSWEWVFKLPNLKNVALPDVDISQFTGTVYPNIAELKLSHGPTLNLKKLAAIFPHLHTLNVFGRHLEGETGIASLNRLEGLVLRSCFLKQLPNAWAGLESLKVLDLSFNQLKRLPAKLLELNLDSLTVWSNCLPDSVCKQVLQKGGWPTMEQKELLDKVSAEQKFESTPLDLLLLSNRYHREDDVSDGSAVEKLERIARGFVDVVDSFFGSEKKLDRLVDEEDFLKAYVIHLFGSVSVPNVEVLRDEVHPEARLEYNVSRTHWRRFRGGRSYLLDSKDMDEILSTALQQHEMGLIDLTPVTELSFKGSSMTAVPVELKDWPNLEAVSFEQTQITHLPDWLADLSLKQIDVTHTPIQSIDTRLLKRCLDVRIAEKRIRSSFLIGMNWRASDALSDLLQLICDAVQKGDLSPESFAVLDFSKTSLRYIPKNIEVLTDLVRLDISNTNVTELPDELLSLPLRHLNVKGLKLSDIPRKAAALSIDRLQYHAWKDTFSQWKRLKILEIREQELTEFPSAVLECSQLERLDLRNNKLREIPDGLSKLTKLTLLLLYKNDLKAYPSIDSLPLSLKGLDIRRNPFETLPIPNGYLNRDIEVRR